MNVSRRDFLKVGALGLGGVVLLGGASTLMRGGPSAKAQGSSSVGLGDYDWEKHYWGFVVDTRKCIGCGACVRACKHENDVPWEPEYNRTWVERYVVTEDDRVFVDSPNAGRDGFAADYLNQKYKDLNIRKAFFTPKLCNQCDKPACVQVCPVAATYRTPDGVILIDQNKCIGCRYCIQACPYGARYFKHSMGVVDKCTWCYHRITKGLPPVCVEVCPRGARKFGDMRDPDSVVRQMLRDENVHVLKPDLGTKPKVFYLGLEQEVK